MMDFNEEEVLISLRGMEKLDELNENCVEENNHSIIRHTSYNHPSTKLSLSWFDIRLFYVKLSNYVILENSTPDILILNHVPSNQNTLLEANGVRTSIYSDGVSTLLKRDRLDKRSGEVTFVSTDSIRMTGSVKFEVFDDNVLVLSGNLELCRNSGSMHWSMSCDPDITANVGFFKGNRNQATIEVFVAGSFLGEPIILTKNLHIGYKIKKQQMRKGMLEAIPECEAIDQSRKDDLSTQSTNNQQDDTPELQDFSSNRYEGIESLEGEGGELSWFNAGVRVGVGIGLSICLGVGIGIGLLVRMYQGTTRNFKRRLL